VIPGSGRKADSSNKIEFSQFKTIDAIHLPKVLNAVSAQKLSERFQTHYDDLRNLRNRLMHSVGRAPIEGPDFYRIVLRSFKYLEPGRPWLKERQAYLERNEDAVLYSGDAGDYVLIKEAVRVIESLKPSDCVDLLGFDRRKRRYLCPSCEATLSSFEDEGAYLCQLSEDDPNHISIRCYLCETSFEVERARCSNEDCKGDVIWTEDQMCLTCGATRQDDT
jgi:hypothetical protein